MGGGRPCLDLGGGARVAIDGSLQFGDPLTVNVTGIDRLDATGGFDVIGGQGAAGRHDQCRRARASGDHRHNAIRLWRLAQRRRRSVLTNNGTLGLGSSNGALGKDGTVSVAVDGHGTLLFRGLSQRPGLFGKSARRSPPARPSSSILRSSAC